MFGVAGDVEVSTEAVLVGDIEDAVVDMISKVVGLSEEFTTIDVPINVNDSDDTASTTPEIVFDDIKEAVEGMVSRLVELADEFTSTYVPVKVDK